MTSTQRSFVAERVVVVVASLVVVAVGVVGALHDRAASQGWLWASRPFVFSGPRDPGAFERDLAVLMPAPVVTLTREDAVAYELIRRSHSLTERQAQRTAQALCAEARSLGYDPLFFVALIHVESLYNHLAISPVGAEGLMQLMPQTAAYTADRYALSWHLGDSFDPVTNVRIGVRYFVELHRRFGRLEAALTAYNRGPTATRRLLEEFGKLPESIQDFYSGKVLSQYRRLIAAYGNLPRDV